MLTDPKLKSQVDRLGDKLWTGGLTNPLDPIEQFSYLLFMKRLDEAETQRERQAWQRSEACEPRLEPELREAERQADHLFDMLLRRAFLRESQMVETMSYHGKQYLRHVRLDIVEYFDQDELRDLTFDLGVNWDDLPGDTISAKARSLTLFMAHRGRLDELVGLLKEERPNVDWPDIPSPQKQIEDAQKALETEAELEKILQDYISEIKNLLLEYNLRHPEKEDAKQIARSHTVLALRKLDEERNQRLIEFLRELKLIGQQPDIINLDRVELRNCELSGIDLSYVDLNWSDFRGSLLNKSNIRGGNLNKALLSNADLERADLRNANLDEAFLSNCYLRWAILHEVSLYRADLYKADLLGADLLGADLREANLVDSILTDALLSEADLDEKYLMFARTSNISLKPANLSKARYSENTKWPDGFDPIARGLILDE